MEYPLWATPQRRAILVRLFQQSGGFCVHGHKPCPDPLHHFEFWIDGEDVVAEVTEYITEPMPFKGSETGFVMNAKTPVKVFRKIHIPGLIDQWKQEDREKAQALWKREQQELTQAPDHKGWGRRFDPVEKELFLLARPPYYAHGIGISGLTFKRVAKIRIPSTYIHLFVEVPKKQSLNARRRAQRYGKGTTGTTDERCLLAVKDFWSKH